MFNRFANYIVDKIFKESSASNLSRSKELILGDVSANDIKSGINDLHDSLFNPTIASQKFEKSIQSYKESIR